MSDGAYLVRDFEEFWPHYVRLHTRPATQLFHAAGSLACLALLVTAAWTRAPALALLGPPLDYGLSQASHRIFERNRTTPWKNQVWHTRAELRMLRLVLTGRMRGEVARALLRGINVGGKNKLPMKDLVRRCARRRPRISRSPLSPGSRSPSTAGS